jgi:hypothetical protein
VPASVVKSGDAVAPEDLPVVAEDAGVGRGVDEPSR